ncbi:hypothetical protein F9C28_04235 [Shimwellia pseudoproteus]|nr:hypothetical protein [Shimwellia pseudoproteus]
MAISLTAQPWLVFYGALPSSIRIPSAIPAYQDYISFWGYGQVSNGKENLNIVPGSAPGADRRAAGTRHDNDDMWPAKRRYVERLHSNNHARGRQGRRSSACPDIMIDDLAQSLRVVVRDLRALIHRLN